MLNQYQQILDRSLPLLISEQASLYHLISEKHLQVMWYEQKYFKELKTHKGENIKVLSPGIWNSESGPDFFKAHLLIGDREVKGDVEIHLADENWTHHHHAEDPAYNHVVLHVSLWKPTHEKPIVTRKGQEILKTYFEDHLTVSLARIAHLVDLDLYPYKQFVGSGKCAHAIFKNLSVNEITSFFESASITRLKKKRIHLKSHMSESTLYLGAGIAMALGYKQNTQQFLDLFNYLLPYRDLPEEEIIAMCFGISGFLENKEKWKENSYFIKLSNLWEPHKHTVLHQTVFRLDHIRPLNHPLRRMVYLAKLLTHCKWDVLWDSVVSLWGNCWSSCKTSRDWSRLIKLMMEYIPHFDDEYWNSHYNFESEVRKEYLPLIGKDFKMALMLNTVFPLLYGEIEEKGDSNQIRAFEQFYSSLPSARSGKTRYLTHRFFGETSKGEVLKKARVEQGAFQLHKDFCVHYEASCVNCPFVDCFKEEKK